jgi:6-phospho-3-hexuloisomerase
MELRLQQDVAKILTELKNVFDATEYKNSNEVIAEICNANKIVCLGAGRVGLSMDSFAKRLMHLGKTAYAHSDLTLPSLGKGDLMIVGSGSGETESILCYAKIAKRLGVRILLLTSNLNSPLSSIADLSLHLNCPNKSAPSHIINSIQPMTTLFEQSILLTLDALVLCLMDQLNVTENEMKARHNVIE